MFEDEYEFTEEELASPRPYTTEQLAERAAANSELAEMLAYINGDVAAAGDSGDGTDPLFDDEYEDSEYEKYVSDEQPRPYTAKAKSL